MQADRFAWAAARWPGAMPRWWCSGLRLARCGARRLRGLCPRGNPGMASGGNGRRAHRVIAAAGAGLETWEAACLGVAAHARAGDVAAQRLGAVGLLAGDVVAGLPPQQLSRADYD